MTDLDRQRGSCSSDAKTPRETLMLPHAVGDFGAFLGDKQNDCTEVFVQVKWKKSATCNMYFRFWLREIHTKSCCIQSEIEHQQNDPLTNISSHSVFHAGWIHAFRSKMSDPAPISYFNIPCFLSAREQTSWRSSRRARRFLQRSWTTWAGDWPGSTPPSTPRWCSSSICVSVCLCLVI